MPLKLKAGWKNDLFPESLSSIGNTILFKAFAFYDTIIILSGNFGDKPRIVDDSWERCYGHPIPVPYI
ncbi:hypothetical protein N7499_000826 [Penicillium canescens]|uniref:Uncharacterized protein n=1 Tax=Penicillium canescens TaxID=5083 RepID=A0AAD6NB57_PENCN|nr:uncharacterized protein N7446_010969 [Penicillium canescens]KAJ6029679.1 hypothetical protein N7444_012666 [Penicillium canescens]KAJ6048111.1 hypothetical protein N7460_004258 [Penicillium canescens]KAJ6048286.1 hypothetical protein N7446_010969 [Penicillium canescens]KAJ6101196.1 hypothetical protein N7499_000826 [Penicillium canescens]KAJ6173654.1 hypothetical protein N7485_006466 [Penicillium canescens]